MVVRLLLGLVCGFVLSRLRLVPGDAWIEGPAVGAQGALLVRGAAVALVGLALGAVGRDVGLAFLVGLAAAVAGHGLVWGAPLGLPAWDVLAAGVALGLLTWRLRSDEAVVEPPIAPAHMGERIGLALAGGGAAFVLEIVARHLRLLGGGLVQDDSAFAAAFAVLVALGGACFGWIGATRAFERAALPWLVAATTTAGLLSLATIESVSQIREFAQFLSRFGLDTTWHGSLAADALFAASILVVPAFLLGAALRSARGTGSLSSLLVGAGLGLALVPRALARDAAAGTTTNELFAAQMLPLGILVAVVGAGLALLSLPGRPARARWIAFACAVPLALPVLVAESKPLLVLSPWERFPTMPFVALETPEGLATVEPGDGGMKLATLDRRRLSPGLSAVRADTQTLENAFRALPADVRAARAVRVLLVGQLTQPRAAVLVAEGAASVDRTGAWHAAMAELERALLEDFAPPPGEIVAPREALERLAAGRYDLVVVPAADGESPRWRAIGDERPAGSVVVRWSAFEFDALGDLPGSCFAGAEAREPAYALTGGGLERLRLGVLDGATRPDPAQAGRLEIARLGDIPRAGPLAHLLERKPWRAAAARLRLANALAAENSGPLYQGLARFAELQAPSSPFETEAQQVELEPATLELLRDAALAGPLSTYVREAWNWLARVLVGKRDVAAIEAYLAPLAQLHAPWPELQLALARADLEALDPAAAVRRLEPLAPGGQGPFDVLVLLGEAREAAGDAAAAIRTWQTASEVRPGDLWLQRRLAMAQVRAGDPAGVPAIQALLSEHPEDEELKVFLGPPPWPAPIQGTDLGPSWH